MCYYQNQAVFENANLSFTNPEIIAIIGDSGAEKTTGAMLIATHDEVFAQKVGYDREIRLG